MAPKQQSTDRIIIINDGWKPIIQGEIIPTLNDCRNYPKGEFLDFIHDISRALEAPDRVERNGLGDIVLRIDMSIQGVSDRRKQEIEQKMFQCVSSTLGSPAILYLVHTKDRKILEEKTIKDWLDKKFNYSEYANAVGAIYGKNGGLIASKKYFFDVHGPKAVEWGGKHYCVNQDRFEKVWNTYYLGLKDRVIELKRQFRLAQAYGKLPWKDTALGKRIGEDLVGFEKFINEETQSESSKGRPKSKESQSVFEMISTQLPKLKAAFDSIKDNAVESEKSWNLINEQLDDWSAKTI